MHAERIASSRSPLGRLAQSVSGLSASAATSIGVALALGAGLLDLLTGPELASLVFYLAPVVLVARQGAKWHGILVAVLAGIMWAGAEGLRGREYDSAGLFIWASVTRLVVFLTITLLLHRLRPGTIGRDAGTGAACPYCGSTNTLALHVGLVCRECKRLSE